MSAARRWLQGSMTSQWFDIVDRGDMAITLVFEGAALPATIVE